MMPSIKSIEVRLDVANVPRSAQFYAAILGFEVGTLWPEESPQFAILSRDGLRLQLGQSESDSTATHLPTSTLWLDVEEIGAFLSQIREDVNVEWGPEVYWYGRCEFAFRDPDGHLVILSEVTCDPPTCEGA
jgi:catechol 2,3-dioxygenase-like lactoylglutathione lyase family enzyme